MKGRIIFILFFSVFAAFSAGFFTFKTLPTLTLWFKAKSWHAVPATITSSNLKVHHGDDSTTYRVTAKYRYFYQGQQFNGDRVSLSTGSDNIGSYHQDTERYLNALKSNGQQVTVWVDPQQPSKSIIDRNMRWGLLLFEGVFILLFGLIGFGGVIWMCMVKDEDSALGFDESRPWLSKKKWSSKTVLSNAKSAHKVMLFFAIFWNLCSLGAYFAIYDVIYGKAEPVALIAIIFPLVGLWMLWFAFKLKNAWKKIGPTPLSMDPYPGSIGGQVGGHIEIVYPGVDRNKLIIKLACIRISRSGDSTKRSVVWQEKLVPAVEAAVDGSCISFCFDVPKSLPESDDEGYPYHEWTIFLEGELPDGMKLDRQYEIPVFATAKSSSIRNMKAKVGNEATKKLHQRHVAEIMPLLNGNDGSKQIYLPIGRNIGVSIFLLLFGGLFFGAGMLFMESAPTFMRWIFTGTGWIVFLIGFYLLANSLKVRIADEGIYTRRYILGIPVKESFIASYAFDKFEHKQTSTFSSGNKHTVFFKVQALGKNGEKLTVAEGFKGRGQAKAAIEKLTKQLPF